MVARIYPFLLFLFLPVLLEGQVKKGEVAEAKHKQARLRDISNKLEARIPEHPGLDERVQMSVNDVSVKEFLRGVAEAHGLNISIDPEVEGRIVNNFSNARVLDVLVYLCKQYRMSIDLIGSIIHFVPYDPPKDTTRQKPKIDPPKVSYADSTDFLSLDLKEDTLERVVAQITKEAPYNVLADEKVRDKTVSVFIQNRPFKSTLKKLAETNGIEVSSSDGRFFVFESGKGEKGEDQKEGQKKTAKGKEGGVQLKKGDVLEIEEPNPGIITVRAKGIKISALIEEVSDRMHKNYFMYGKPKGKTDLYVENATYEGFLNYLLAGTKFTYKVSDKDVYLIGERKQEKLRTTELIQMENRTIESVIDKVVPQHLKEGLQIKKATSLNSIVVSGSRLKVHKLRKFIQKVDRVVPVVMIEVMIVDVKKDRSVETDFEMGVGGENKPKSSGGTVISGEGAQYRFDSKSINQMIGTFNGFGIVNLGKVTPDFYMNLKALENNGVINTRSTPQLSTMNATEASMTIGSKEYYLEVQNNVIGSQNPQVVNTQNYKSVSADLTINIEPIVTGGDHVNLTIDVKQSDFTGRISPQAPPGSVTRDFSSQVRVKNGEMILLGGLEDRTKERSSSGLPLLARIPVLKWLFASQKHSKSEDRLNVFIKPTIIR